MTQTYSLTEADIDAIADKVVARLEARFSVRPKPAIAKASGRRPGRPAKTDHEYLVAVVKTVATRRPDGLAYRSVDEIRRALGSNPSKIKVAARAAYDAKLIRPDRSKSRNCQEFHVTDLGIEWLAKNA